MSSRLQRTRSGNPCDGCALRRVRCRGGPPCAECIRRSLQCTFLRVPRKRGPKGPRLATVNKIQLFQDQLEEAMACNQDNVAFQDSPPQSRIRRDSCSSSYKEDIPAGRTPRSLHLYVKYLCIFHDRLRYIWPIVCVDDLIAQLVSCGSLDYDSYALSAAVCAACIAQLRLPQHKESSRDGSTSEDDVTSEDFVRDTRHFRDQYDFREKQSTASLLTSFFLHIYYANTNKIRTAGVFLRESIAQLHLLGFHRLEEHASLPLNERELRLRVFWILFVSERTFCLQNGLPITINPIEEWPSAGWDPTGCGDLDSSFHCLTQLFTLLDGDLIEKPSSSSGHQLSNSARRPRNEVSMIHTNLLTFEASAIGLDETERVNIFVTRNWIRILWWEYALRNFTMSRHADDQAFSMLLPATVAHEMLSFFTSVSNTSICAHGYGMELKVFRIADSLLDVLACRELDALPSSMVLGSRDALKSLEQTLTTVGGDDSLFLKKLHLRMAAIQLPLPDANSLPCPPLTGYDQDEDAAVDESSLPESVENVRRMTGTHYR